MKKDTLIKAATITVVVAGTTALTAACVKHERKVAREKQALRDADVSLTEAINLTKELVVGDMKDALDEVENNFREQYKNCRLKSATAHLETEKIFYNELNSYLVASNNDAARLFIENELLKARVLELEAEVKQMEQSMCYSYSSYMY